MKVQGTGEGLIGWLMGQALPGWQLARTKALQAYRKERLWGFSDHQSINISVPISPCLSTSLTDPPPLPPQAKAKIMVIRDIERPEIEFISKTLNCLPIAHVDHMKPEKLGSAALVEEVEVRERDSSRGRAGARKGGRARAVSSKVQTESAPAQGRNRPSTIHSA